uniref:COesterase domain-containing protein n=1 Tax=Parastrongyloides trichosuri TaxID=131310 RepID=A0A0N5A299_PARTI
MIFRLLLAILLHSPYILSKSAQVVHTTNGKIRGNHLNITGTTVREYLGIPYAMPPVNESRFGIPKPWIKNGKDDSIFNATKFGNSCMQGYYPQGFESKYFNDTFENQSEDCLYLNIWVPRTGSKNNSEDEDSNDDDKKKGVLVFIHGGGLRYGSSSFSMYNGSYLAAKTKLIVVTMNYRLGVFGFAYMSKGDNITGNMGLLDQQLALKWVHENIANFTGDPNNVTLWGQGAGAACAAAHLFSKNSENYFQKLILMSGSITNLLYSVEESTIDNSVRTLAQLLNCTRIIKTQGQSLSHQQVFDCLINKTNEEVLKQSEIVTYYTNMPSLKGFNIILNDSVFFNGSVFEKLKNGNMKYYVDVLFGMPNNDGSFFLPILKNAT